jgi:hypothetical protein
MKHGEILIYRTNDKSDFQIEVRVEDETIWLTQAQIVTLFSTSKANVSEHINHIYKTRELDVGSTVRNFRIVQMEGKRKVTRNVTHYNLDMIISIGYRVNSIRGTEFRIWANKVLKSYLLNGYAIRHQFDQIEKKIEQHDKTLSEHDQKFELLIKTHSTPVEGIFYDGQIFDAWKFASDLVKSARRSIVLIDNYVDESVLTLLSKRNKGVTATIYTASDSKQFNLDLKKFNDQYDSIDLRIFDKSHDRFLIIDRTIVYHIGASLKDLGKKWFAFSKINLDASAILKKLN